MVNLSYFKFILVIGILVGYFAQSIVSQNCGCSGIYCCSRYGYCGTGDAYCGKGCQSGPCSTKSSVSLESIVTPEFFSRIVSQADSAGCDGKNFYSYEAFHEAAKSYPSFGRTGSMDNCKREIAAFFAHAAHVTGHFCYKEEIKGSSKDYCDEGNKQFPCASGKGYYGRGPMQLTWNYNYGPAGKSIGFDGINEPETVANDAVISFKTAFWFWMNNIHSIITSNQGFGATIRAVNGMECNGGNFEAVLARVSYYNTYCTQLSVEPGNNLSC